MNCKHYIQGLCEKNKRDCVLEDDLLLGGCSDIERDERTWSKPANGTREKNWFGYALCPFCGSDDVLAEVKCSIDHYRKMFYWETHCRGCGARTKEYKTRDEAKEAWNRRAT